MKYSSGDIFGSLEEKADLPIKQRVKDYFWEERLPHAVTSNVKKPSPVMCVLPS